MKIGIITQPLRDSSGGILQNYALQTVLKRLGHTPVTLDWGSVGDPSTRAYIKFVLLRLAQLIGKKEALPSLVRASQWKVMRANPQLFVKKYIHKTEIIDNDEWLRAKVSDLGLEACIVGSDQVWRPEYNRNIFKPFLDFTQGLRMKRLAYAASFGVDDWRYSATDTLRCRELLEKFDAVSVREDTGIDLCRQFLETKAVQVLDPALMLDKEDYEALVMQENEVRSDGELLTFILDKSEQTDLVISTISQRLGLRPFNVSRPNKLPPFVWNKDLQKYAYPRITQWLRGFMDAKFVVCDSFHGTVFSIIFNKPFIVLSNQERGNARFTSLLGMFGLEGRLTDGTDLSILTDPIDWARVNEIRTKWQEKSLSFITEALK